MVQQKGMKRAAKVAVRKKKIKFQDKLARAKKAIRQALAPKEEAEKE